MSGTTSNNEQMSNSNSGPLYKPFIFDDKKSFLHFAAGVIAAMTGVFSIFFILIFVLYQIKEEENDLNKIGDFIEFLLGYSYGLSVGSK